MRESTPVPRMQSPMAAARGKAPATTKGMHAPGIWEAVDLDKRLLARTGP